MPYRRRDRLDIEKCLRFITCRVLEGSPFQARETIKFVILGILGKAQKLYSIRLHAFVFMESHCHFLISGKAKDISPFIGYVNAGIAKAFRRFTNQYRGKFWAKRFKEQKLQSVYDVIKMLAHIFLNPVKAGLVSDPKDYSGLISCNLPRTISVKWTRPSKIGLLCVEYNYEKELEEVKRLEGAAEEEYNLRIDLFGWKDCFNEQVDEDILGKILEKELRKEVEKDYLSAEELMKQEFYKEWGSKKKALTSFIIC